MPAVVVPVDPTAVGDGFNAGYLAARLAGEVMRHGGAITPRIGTAVH